MSSLAVDVPDSNSAGLRIVDQTAEACGIAKEAAALATDCIATRSQIVLNTLREQEIALDRLELEINSGVAAVITQGNERWVHELLACMKLAVGLKRIGELLLSVGTSARGSGSLDAQDTRDLVRMATVVEKMLTDVDLAFASRDLTKAVDVLKVHIEMERIRSVILARHMENSENIQGQASLQIVSMTQSLERAADQAKTLAEEICRFVSGNTVRHGLITHDKPVEQIFLNWLQCRSGNNHRSAQRSSPARTMRIQIRPAFHKRGTAR